MTKLRTYLARCAAERIKRKVSKQAKHYLVTLEIRNGEVGKMNRHLIRNAVNEDDAIERAIQMESHDREDGTLPEDRWYEDLGGEYAYRVSKIQPVPPSDIETLSLYL